MRCRSERQHVLHHVVPCGCRWQRLRRRRPLHERRCLRWRGIMRGRVRASGLCHDPRMHRHHPHGLHRRRPRRSQVDVEERDRRAGERARNPRHGNTDFALCLYDRRRGRFARRRDEVFSSWRHVRRASVLAEERPRLPLRRQPLDGHLELRAGAEIERGRRRSRSRGRAQSWHRRHSPSPTTRR